MLSSAQYFMHILDVINGSYLSYLFQVYQNEVKLLKKSENIMNVCNKILIHFRIGYMWENTESGMAYYKDYNVSCLPVFLYLFSHFP